MRVSVQNLFKRNSHSNTSLKLAQPELGVTIVHNWNFCIGIHNNLYNIVSLMSIITDMKIT